MKLTEVTTPGHKQEFLEFPARLYQDHPNWIRPLDQDIENVFDPAKNRNFARGKAIRWLLSDQTGQTIGRVAAFINAGTSHTTTQPTGGMGFFECINNPEAAFALFDACKTWLQANGMEAMDGPINFGERDKWWGLLVDGFTEPNYGMFYHMPYYQHLFEAYGFQVYFKQYTCHREVADNLHPRIYQRVAEITKDKNYSFRHANKKNLDKLAEDFLEVYNKAWASHSNINPMSLDKARALVKAMKPVMDERLIWFGYYQNKPVGFFVMLPELNQVFKHVNGKLDLIGKLKFLYYRWKFNRKKKDKKLFGVIFGVVPEHQGKGIETAMIMAVKDTVIGLNYTDLEMNWIGDFNPKMLTVIRTMGATICKTHITYRKLFDETKPFERYPVIR